jgi:hypothetical protein
MGDYLTDSRWDVVCGAMNGGADAWHIALRGILVYTCQRWMGSSSGRDAGDGRGMNEIEEGTHA